MLQEALLVKDLMSHPVLKIDAQRLICEVSGIFDRQKISGAPVIDEEGIIIGIISKSDIVHFEVIGGDPFVTRAYEIAHAPVISIDLKASLKDY